MLDLNQWDYSLDEGNKHCNSCEGEGKYPICDMCGGDVDADTLLCYGCHEHSDFSDCEDCQGEGVKDLTNEEIIELKHNDGCCKADDIFSDNRCTDR